MPTREEMIRALQEAQKTPKKEPAPTREEMIKAIQSANTPPKVKTASSPPSDLQRALAFPGSVTRTALFTSKLGQLTRALTGEPLESVLDKKLRQRDIERAMIGEGPTTLEFLSRRKTEPTPTEKFLAPIGDLVADPLAFTGSRAAKAISGQVLKKGLKFIPRSKFLKPIFKGVSEAGKKAPKAGTKTLDPTSIFNKDIFKTR